MSIERFIPTWANGGKAIMFLTISIVVGAVGWQVYGYVSFQRGVLESDDYQKLLRQNVAVGAGLMSVVRTLNVEVLPEAKTTLIESQRGLQTLNAEIARVGRVTTQLEMLVAQTSERINGESGTLVQLNSNLRSIERTSDTATAKLNDLGAEATATIAALRGRVEDPKLDEIVVSLNQTAANAALLSSKLTETGDRVNRIAAQTEVAAINIAGATAEVKEAAGETKKTMQNVTKFSKITSVLRVGVLAATILTMVF